MIIDEREEDCDLRRIDTRRTIIPRTMDEAIEAWW